MTTEPARRTERVPHRSRAWSTAAAAYRRSRMASRTGEVPATETFVGTLLGSIGAAEPSKTPYRRWMLRRCLPDEAVAAIEVLPFPPPVPGDNSGRRELNDASRTYFDVATRARFPVCERLCQALQDERVTAAIASEFGAHLAGTYLRVEYAQDTDGFWLEPHTGLSVEAFTMLLYVSRHPQHATLGTDIYDTDKTHVARTPFAPNTALAFVPSDNTFHGFEPRPIEGVRTSVIVSYVTSESAACEQLAFPDRPV